MAKSRRKNRWKKPYVIKGPMRKWKMMFFRCKTALVVDILMLECWLLDEVTLFLMGANFAGCGRSGSLFGGYWL